jgi:hypothetical protein
MTIILAHDAPALPMIKLNPIHLFQGSLKGFWHFILPKAF